MREMRDGRCDQNINFLSSHNLPSYHLISNLPSHLPSTISSLSIIRCFHLPCQPQPQDVGQLILITLVLGYEMRWWWLISLFQFTISKLNISQPSHQLTTISTITLSSHFSFLIFCRFYQTSPPLTIMKEDLEWIWC